MKKLPLILLALLSLSIVAIAAKRTDDDADMQRRKARYYYLEGSRKMAEGATAEGIEYYKKAYLLDSTYSEAAQSYGMVRFWMYTDTLQTERERRKSLAMMKGFVEEYPADITESMVYAYAADGMDTLSREGIRIYERLDSLYPTNPAVLMRLVDVYDKAGRFDDAISALTRMEGKNGKTAQISLHKIGLMLNKRDTVAAINEATALVESNPRDASFRILKGNLYEVIGMNDSTLAYYKQAEALSPDNGGAKLALANFYKQQGDSVEYDKKVYEALLTENFEMEEKLAILGEYLQTLMKEKNNTQRGDHLFNVLMEQYPHEPDMLDLAGRYSAAKGEFDKAAQYIEYAIDQESGNKNYWEMLMRYQYAGDKPREAMSTYKKAKSALESVEGVDLRDMTLLYAAAASSAEDFDEALGVYQGLINEIAPGLPLTDSIADKQSLANLSYENLVDLNKLYTAVGDTYYQMKRTDLTFKAYDNAIFFIPDNPMTLNNYAYFLTESGGDLDKALAYSSKAIETEGENPTFLDTYAWVLFKRKEFSKALEYQQKAIEYAEKEGDELSAEYFHHLGDILFMNHEPEKAVENWEKALKLEPENALLKKKVAHKTFFFE